MAGLRGGQHYPGSAGEFQAWFRTDSDCLDYLEWLRWPGGFTCPSRLRSVLVRPGRDRLGGRVEVDETYIGGEEPGLRGGRARGKKVLTGIAVEVRQPRGIGRCRMALLADGSSASLHPFVAGHVEPGATVITDAWMGYHGLAGLGYVHERRSQRAARARGDDPGELLPAVHRVASLARRWLLSTHQGLGRGGAPAELSGRVRVPLQPAPLGQPRPGVLPAARARRRPRPGPLPQHRGRQAATKDPADAASQARASSEPGAAICGAPVEGRWPGLLRLNGDP
jgi:ISXO2-like transposase domain